MEDESAVREMLQENLAGDGHAVEAAANGRQALEKIHANSFDLIIADRGMPVILLTGFGDMMIAAGESPDGVDLILNKPITLNELREGLSRIIESK